jgi:hypothetical protein
MVSRNRVRQDIEKRRSPLGGMVGYSTGTAHDHSIRRS